MQLALTLAKKKLASREAQHSFASLRTLTQNYSDLRAASSSLYCLSIMPPKIGNAKTVFVASRVGAIPLDEHDSDGQDILSAAKTQLGLGDIAISEYGTSSPDLPRQLLSAIASLCVQ